MYSRQKLVCFDNALEEREGRVWGMGGLVDLTDARASKASPGFGRGTRGES